MPPGLEPAELPADAVEVGRILDAWGIKGWFKVQPYSAESEALFSCKRWLLLPAAKGRKAFDDVALLRIKQAKVHADTVVACAHDVDGRDAADVLRGCRIFVARSSFPTPSPNEFYWVDLIGLSVFNRQDVRLGQVRELLSTGPQTVLVIDDVQDGQARQRMIPFVAAYVDDVDLAAKRIVVDWQPEY